MARESGSSVNIQHLAHNHLRAFYANLTQIALMPSPKPIKNAAHREIKHRRPAAFLFFFERQNPAFRSMTSMTLWTQP